MTSHNPSYTGPRPDVERLVPRTSRKILDVGCSTGKLGASLKRATGAHVTGIELSESMAREAVHVLDEVHCGDAQKILEEGKLKNGSFDAIIFADILEHLIDPWAALRAASTHLSPEGTIIASIPNIRHYTTIIDLALLGIWPYRDRGIHDRTHLRFFTLRNIRDLFNDAGLRIDCIRTNYRLLERPHRINRAARYLAIPGIRGLLAFQYIITATARK
jgi:2-polyprenyl-3-methyl-5-hydroxy-6-metoxy-1,4-benzoquinol methylase